MIRSGLNSEAMSPIADSNILFCSEALVNARTGRFIVAPRPRPNPLSPREPVPGYHGYWCIEKKKTLGDGYKPIVSVSTKRLSSPLGDVDVEIIVHDNGLGIPQKVIDKIFQPFFTTKPTGQGTGLGLSLSYDIIKAHGGEIKVETKESEGTTFIIQLPNYSS